MDGIIDLGGVQREFIDDADFKTMLKTVMVGEALGTEKLYVNVDFVKPGAKSAKYHSHSMQEEFFLILRGRGILRLNGEETAVKPGDFISKPAGRGIAHQFINDGTDILQILDIGTREKNDIVTYPDENTVYIRNKKLVFHADDKIEGWTSDPNGQG
jgi:uncharacterized cupin superfamily protein